MANANPVTKTTKQVPKPEHQPQEDTPQVSEANPYKVGGGAKLPNHQAVREDF